MDPRENQETVACKESTEIRESMEFQEFRVLLEYLAEWVYQGLKENREIPAKVVVQERREKRDRPDHLGKLEAWVTTASRESQD
ncbi:hypothetical protein FKM82_001805 [Ascaphus truei]